MPLYHACSVAHNITQYYARLITPHMHVQQR